MKNSKIDLFNIDILTPNAKDVFGLGQVTDPNIFETNSKIFRKGGLYDPEIFGKPGTAERAETFGYIDLILPILHPLIYQTLTELGIVYNNIAEAKVYAKYDSRVGDFIVTDREHGDTGYTFLLDNIHKIKFDSRGSDRRDIKVKLVKKYATKERYMTKLLVLPAGLRDYTEDKAGRPSEDEINNLYRKLLAVTTMIKNIDTKGNYALLNSVRLKIQKCVIEIYQYIKTLIDGKHKFIQGQFTKRAVSYGTRNVITPMENDVKDLTKTSTPKINTVTVGLYQYIKSVTPIAINRVLGMFVNSILNQSTTSAYLVDPKTMKTTLVEVSVKKRDEWLSVQGLTDIMNKLGQPEQRNLPVLIDKWYMFCVYDDGKTVIRLDHTDDLPEGLDRKHVRPITYAELFYLTVCDISSKYPAFVTRYPVVEVGGTYPCKVYLKTTVKGRTITYKYRQYEKEVREYPVIGGLYVESMSPHNTRLGRLGADFDGDTCSLNVLYTEDSVKEVDDFLGSKEAYLSPTGEILYSSANDISDLVMSTLTE